MKWMGRLGGGVGGGVFGAMSAGAASVGFRFTPGELGIITTACGIVSAVLVAFIQRRALLKRPDVLAAYAAERLERLERQHDDDQDEIADLRRRLDRDGV